MRYGKMEVSGSLVISTRANMGSAVQQAVAILPIRSCLGDLLSRTSNDTPYGDIMTYLLHLAVDRGPSDLTRFIEYARSHATLSRTQPSLLHAHEKMLIASLLLRDRDAFHENVHDTSTHQLCHTSADLSEIFFRKLSMAFGMTGQSMTDPANRESLDHLISHVSKRRWPDVLRNLQSPSEVAKNPRCYVAEWIDRNLKLFKLDFEGTLGTEEAELIMDICIMFKDGFNRVSQYVISCLLNFHC